MTDFAPDAVLSFFEQTKRAAERRARLWGKPAPRRVNVSMQQPTVRSEHPPKIEDGIEWRRCPDAPLYEVSTEGDVRHAGTGHRAKRYRDRQGSVRVSLYVNKGSKAIRVHNLVATAFLGARPAFCGVRHRDGNKENCRLSNLYYGAKGEHLSMPKDSNGRSKLSLDEVKQMRTEYAAGGVSTRQLAARFGVSAGQIQKITSGQQWRDI